MMVRLKYTIKGYTKTKYYKFLCKKIGQKMIIDSERLKKQFADLELLKKELEAIRAELEEIKKDILL